MNKLTLIFLIIFALALVGGLAYTIQNNRPIENATTKQIKQNASQPGADATTNASLKITQ